MLSYMCFCADLEGNLLFTGVNNVWNKVVEKNKHAVCRARIFCMSYNFQDN
jgi:hypothetical protein